MPTLLFTFVLSALLLLLSVKAFKSLEDRMTNKILLIYFTSKYNMMMEQYRQARAALDIDYSLVIPYIVSFQTEYKYMVELRFQMEKNNVDDETRYKTVEMLNVLEDELVRLNKLISGIRALNDTYKHQPQAPVSTISTLDKNLQLA